MTAKKKQTESLEQILERLRVKAGGGDLYDDVDDDVARWLQNNRTRSDGIYPAEPEWLNGMKSLPKAYHALFLGSIYFAGFMAGSDDEQGAIEWVDGIVEEGGVCDREWDKVRDVLNELQTTMARRVEQAWLKKSRRQRGKA